MTFESQQQNQQKLTALAHYIESFRLLGQEFKFLGEGAIKEQAAQAFAQSLHDKISPAFGYIANACLSLKHKTDQIMHGHRIIDLADSLKNDIADNNRFEDNRFYIAQTLRDLFQMANHAHPDHKGFEDDVVAVSPSLTPGGHVWMIFKSNAEGQEPLVAYDFITPPMKLSAALEKTANWATDTSEYQEYRRGVAKFLAPFAK